MINHIFLRPVVFTAIKVALFVGTALALINHGPALLALELSREQILQIALTYLAPYGGLHLLINKNAAESAS